MPTIRLACLAAGLVHRYAFAILMTSQFEVFGGSNIGGLLSKPPIRQNKFPAKISGHTVVHDNCMCNECFPNRHYTVCFTLC